MKVIDDKQFREIDIGPLVVAIGSFDGLHKGHQEIIKETKKIAKRYDLKSGVFSFEPHPLEVIRPEIAPAYLMSNNQKIEVLDKLGIDVFLKQNFTKEFSKINFDSFISMILLKNLNVQHIVVGNDFKFGYKGLGNTEELKKLGEKYNFSVDIIEPVKFAGMRISSTVIRDFIKNGNLEKACKYLGRNYQLEGRVVHGDKRGRELGIPTANLKLKTDYILPPDGVYATYVYYNNNRYKGILNLGTNPTFTGDDYRVEVHIFNFDIEIYGETLVLELVDFIREEKNFDNHEKLIAQIKKDILYTASLLC